MSASTSGLRVMALSDVAFGYGSPQLVQLLSSILDRFPVSRCIAVEPDQKGRTPKRLADTRIEVQRIITTMPPYDAAFVGEFARKSADLVEAFQPDIVIATHGFVLPAVLMQARQPAVFIYYMLESIAHQTHGMGELAVELNRRALADADIVLSPERRRTQADMNCYGWSRSDVIEVLNVAPKQDGSAPAAAKRLRRILHAGSLGPQTLTDFMLGDEVSDVEFDVAGPVDDAGARAFVAEAAKRPNIRLLGMLPNEKLWKIRQNYAYSLAMWKPDNINQLFASPNKFFESIAAGTPVIAGPHPQCADLLAKHQCGLVMMDWTIGQFAWAVRHAMELFDEAVEACEEEGVDDRPAEYDQMVSNCKAAAESELNWERQVAPVLERIAALIKSASSGKRRIRFGG